MNPKINFSRKTSVGEIIRDLRKAGLSRAELGWAILGKTVSRAAAEAWVKRIETDRDLKISELMAICDYFGKSPGYFFPTKCDENLVPEEVVSILERIYRSDNPELKEFMTRTVMDFGKIILAMEKGMGKKRK